MRGMVILNDSDKLRGVREQVWAFLDIVRHADSSISGSKTPGRTTEWPGTFPPVIQCAFPWSGVRLVSRFSTYHLALADHHAAELV